MSNSLVHFGNIIAGTGQQIFLPLWLSTFQGQKLGPYFILFFAGLMFNVIFWSMCIPLFYKGKITKEMLQLRWQPYLALIGVFDALNGFCIVYNSSTSRISGPLQSILTQTIIIFTVIFTKLILSKNPSAKQLSGIVIVLIGIFIALIPTWTSVYDGDEHVTASKWYYPVFFIFGCIPGALMNIVMEKLQKKFRIETDQDFSALYLQAIESVYQFIFFIAFFWLDIIPIFGTSHNITEWSNSLSSGFTCFFNIAGNTERCQYNAIFGCMFMISYTATYIFSTFTTQYGSANLLAIIMTLPTVLSNIIWFVIPNINSWAGGGKLGLYDFIWNMVAIVIIVIGIVLYKSDKLSSQDEILMIQHGDDISQSDYEPI